MIFKTFNVPDEIKKSIFQEIENMAETIMNKMLFDFNNREKEDLIFSNKEYFPVYRYFTISKLSINEILDLPEFFQFKAKLKKSEHSTIQDLSHYLYTEMDYILEQQIYGYWEQTINDLVSESPFLFSPYLMAMDHPFTEEEFVQIYHKNDKKKKFFDLKTHILDYNRFILANYVLKKIKEQYFFQDIYKNWLI